MIQQQVVQLTAQNTDLAARLKVHLRTPPRIPIMYGEKLTNDCGGGDIFECSRAWRSYKARVPPQRSSYKTSRYGLMN